MTEFENEPVIRDKRRLDPTTGRVRAEGGAAGDGGTPPAGHAPAATGEAAPDPVTDATPSPTDATPSPTDATPSPTDATASETDPVAAAKAEAADLFDQVQRAKADYYNLDARFNSFVKRSRTEAAAERARGVEEVVESLIPVLDDLEYARQHGELEGPFAAIAEKLEGILLGRFSVERFGAVGDGFDPTLHEALMHEESEEAVTDTVNLVLQPGYRVGERVVRPARVSVTGPA